MNPVAWCQRHASQPELLPRIFTDSGCTKFRVETFQKLRDVYLQINTKYAASTPINQDTDFPFLLALVILAPKLAKLAKFYHQYGRVVGGGGGWSAHHIPRQNGRTSSTFSISGRTLSGAGRFTAAGLAISLFRNVMVASHCKIDTSRENLQEQRAESEWSPCALLPHCKVGGGQGGGGTKEKQDVAANVS